MKQRKRGRNRETVNLAELSKHISLVRPAIEKTVMGLGFHLVDISFTHENQENYLRLTIMHEDRLVSMDNCELISRSVGKELDSLDPIPFSYMLEVQSRGAVTAPLQGINENTSENSRHEFVLEKIGLTVRS